MFGPDERTLTESGLAADPHRQFRTWLQEAVDAGEPMPTAMALATTTADGGPSVRMILLDDVDERGFTFQTNLESPKARDLAALPRAALAFFWPRLVRQVRVSGTVHELARDEVAALYAEAPAPIQAMIRACRQSQIIADRSTLEAHFAEALAAGDAGLPAHWGGYRVRADSIEFWQGRANRLQDRLRYTRLASGWHIERLEP